MSEIIDLNTLEQEQLMYLVQVRGQALAMHHQADDVLMTKLTDGTFEEGDFERYVITKSEILHGLTAAEEQIIGGAQKPLAN